MLFRGNQARDALSAGYYYSIPTEEKMFRKTLLATVAAVLVSTSVTAIPADAATKISNGVACSKVGATTKVSGYSYKCAKNTLVKNSKLTWLSVECLTAITQYNAAVKAQATVANVQTQLAELDAQLLAANDALTKATTALDAAKAQVTKSRATLNMTTDAALKLKLSNEVFALAEAISKLSLNRSKLSTQVRALEAKKLLISSAPGQLASNVVDTKASATLLCAKGF